MKFRIKITVAQVEFHVKVNIRELFLASRSGLVTLKRGLSDRSSLDAAMDALTCFIETNREQM